MNIFITGGTTGIGLALAQLYLAEGHRVAVCGRDLSKLPPTFQGEKFQVDVTSRQEVLDAVRLFSQNGLDLMIASAGISLGEKARLPEFKIMQEILAVNVMGVVYAFEAAMEIMRRQGSGHLVAMGSVAGLVGLPGAAGYSGSKACVLKICESLAIDLRDLGIFVTAIAPGFIDTPLTRKNNHPMPFLMSVETAARKIKKAIAARRSIYIFPLRMRVLMTILAWLPRNIYLALMILLRRYQDRLI